MGSLHANQILLTLESFTEQRLIRWKHSVFEAICARTVTWHHKIPVCFLAAFNTNYSKFRLCTVKRCLNIKTVINYFSFEVQLLLAILFVLYYSIQEYMMQFVQTLFVERSKTLTLLSNETDSNRSLLVGWKAKSRISFLCNRGWGDNWPEEICWNTKIHLWV